MCEKRVVVPHESESPPPLLPCSAGPMCPHQAFWPGGGWCKKIWTPPLPGLTRLHPLGSPRLNPQTHPASPQSRY